MTLMDFTWPVRYKDIKRGRKGARNCDVKMIVKLRPGNNMLTTTIIPGVLSIAVKKKDGRGKEDDLVNDLNFD